MGEDALRELLFEKAVEKAVQKPQRYEDQLCGVGQCHIRAERNANLGTDGVVYTLRQHHSVSLTRELYTDDSRAYTVLNYERAKGVLAKFI